MSLDALARVRALGCDLVLADAEHLKLVGPREARAQVRDLVLANKPALLAHLRGQAGAKIIPFVLPAPKADALLAHCTRVRPDTSAADADVQALAAYFDSMGREAAIASERRLWVWWKNEPNPTVAAFLASEPAAKTRGNAA
jgi:hypothetical protein